MTSAVRVWVSRWFLSVEGLLESSLEYVFGSGRFASVDMKLMRSQSKVDGMRLNIATNKTISDSSIYHQNARYERQ